MLPKPENDPFNPRNNFSFNGLILKLDYHYGYN